MRHKNDSGTDGAFFDARLQGYDEHMLRDILGAREFFHYDTPLTVAHETEALLAAGFGKVEVLRSWGATYTLRAFQ